MTSEPQLFAVDAILPMDPALPPVLFDAAVIVTGDRITAVGQRSDLRRQFGDLPAARHHAGSGSVLLPGLINPHTHLELSCLRGQLPSPSHFTHWVAGLMARQPPADRLETVVTTAVRDGLAESLRAGVTTVGDISRHCALSRRIIAAAQQDAAPRVISFGEIVALGKMRDRLRPLLDAAAQAPPGSPDRLSIGLSPHAPYTVEERSLETIVRKAIVKRLPVAMHLAEVAAETDFLLDLSGPLGLDWDLMQKLDVLDFKIPSFDGGPIRWAEYCGLLITAPRPFPVLLAHVNYCDHAELAQLAACHVSVAYCPRTHEFFHHPPHRYRDMLDAGINVCLATDSLASNPDLSVLREAQRLHQRDALPAQIALDMITRRAAIALGWGHHLGTLAPGKLADMIVLPVALPEDRNPTTLLETLLATAPQPSTVYLGGIAQPMPGIP